MDIRNMLRTLDLLDLVALAEAIRADAEAVVEQIDGIAVQVDERLELQYEQFQYEWSIRDGMGWEF